VKKTITQEFINKLKDSLGEANTHKTSTMYGTFVDIRAVELILEDNVRDLENYDDIEELATDIQNNGLLTPISVYRIRNKNEFFIEDGFRRTVALHLLMSKGVSPKIQTPSSYTFPLIPVNLKGIVDEKDVNKIKNGILVNRLKSNDSKSLTQLEWSRHTKQLFVEKYNLLADDGNVEKIDISTNIDDTVKKVKSDTIKYLIKVLNKSDRMIRHWLKLSDLSEQEKQELKSVSVNYSVYDGTFINFDTAKRLAILEIAKQHAAEEKTASVQTNHLKSAIEEYDKKLMSKSDNVEFDEEKVVPKTKINDFVVEQEVLGGGASQNPYQNNDEDDNNDDENHPKLVSNKKTGDKSGGDKPYFNMPIYIKQLTTSFKERFPNAEVRGSYEIGDIVEILENLTDQFESGKTPNQTISFFERKLSGDLK
jgi:hypothetical protein